MTFAYLDDPTLLEVQRTAIGLGFASDLDALTAGISPAFVGAHTKGGNANAVHVLSAMAVLADTDADARRRLHPAIESQ